MIALRLIALLQAAPTAVPPVPEKFSILLPECAPAAPESDILVCGTRDRSARLPLRDDRGPPDHGVPSNPHRTGVGALAATGAPCATLQGGCEVGVNVLGPPVVLVRLLTKLINPANDCCEPGEATDPMALARDGVRGIKAMFAKRPGKSGRIAIPLDDPPPPPLQP